MARAAGFGAAALGLWLLYVPSHAASAPPRINFGRLTTEHGLSNNWVLAVLRDHQGFLWIGTQDGLNRYDGRSFKTYRPSPTDPHSLPFRVASRLFEDGRGRLWVGGPQVAGGLARYDRERDAFVRYPHGSEPNQLGSRVNAILGEQEGRLWIATEKGIALFDPERGVLKTLVPTLPQGGAAAPLAYALARDRSGGVWVGTEAGLFLIDRALERCVPWQGLDGGDPSGLEGKRIEALFPDDEGNLWVGSLGAGLFRLDLEARRIARYVPRSDDPASLSSARVRRIAGDRSGRIWIGTEDGGLNLHDPQSGGFDRYQVVPGQESGLGSNAIFALDCDRQGILWVGTFDDGLNCVSPHRQRFERVTAGPDRLSDSNVNAIQKDRQGNLWVGTAWGGLNRIDGRTGRFTYFRHDPRNPRTLGSDSVFTLGEDAAGYIWLGGSAGSTRVQARSPVSGTTLATRGRS